MTPNQSNKRDKNKSPDSNFSSIISLLKLDPQSFNLWALKRHQFLGEKELEFKTVAYKLSIHQLRKLIPKFFWNTSLSIGSNISISSNISTQGKKLMCGPYDDIIWWYLSAYCLDRRDLIMSIREKYNTSLYKVVLILFRTNAMQDSSRMCKISIIWLYSGEVKKPAHLGIDLWGGAMGASALITVPLYIFLLFLRCSETFLSGQLTTKASKWRLFQYNPLNKPNSRHYPPGQRGGPS